MATGKRILLQALTAAAAKQASLSGSVVVYKGAYEPLQMAVLEGENAMDKFAYALASGDLNNDGATDLIVGAPLHSPSPSLYQGGSVYVYFGPTYSQTNVIKIPATRNNSGIVRADGPLIPER